MHDFPGSRASRSLGAAKDQHAQPVPAVPDDEDVDDTNEQVGHRS
jgi:hypothetical protein